MPNERTNSLYETLSKELMDQINADLVDRPQGRASYTEVYEYYKLQERGISYSALWRHGDYIRLMARNRSIRDLADKVTDVEGISQKNAALIRTRLFEVLTDEEAKPSDILNLVIADSTAVRTGIKQEEWEHKKAQIAAAIALSRKDEDRDPHMAVENLRNALVEIYNIDLPEKK